MSAAADPGGAAGWVTSVTSLVDDRATLHGYDLLDLASEFDFTSLTYLAWTSRLPTQNEKSMLDTLLGSLIVHGVAPTGAIARGLVRSGVPTQVAIGGALLSIGDIHGGAGERLGAVLVTLAEQVGLAVGDDPEPGQVEKAAGILLQAFAGQGGRVPGLGHAAHPDGDPRATVIFRRASELGVAGFHCAVMAEVERRVGEKRGRAVPCNVDGAMTAVLCDLGIDWRYSRVLLMTSRTVGLGAQVIEEQLQPTPRWREAMLPREIYQGPELRDVPPREG